MKDGVIALAIVIAGALITAKLDGFGDQRFTGRFVAVDGDTISHDGQRFRLIGIDAPELRQTCFRGEDAWPCGDAARDRLKSLLQSASIECKGNSKDKYGRLLVRCSANGQDVAGGMVAAGLAVATEYFLFSREQTEAKTKGAGIWSGDFQQPRDWRREHKAADMDTPFAGMLQLFRHLVGW